MATMTELETQSLWRANEHEGQVQIWYGDTPRLLTREEAIPFGMSILESAGYTGFVGGLTNASRVAGPKPAANSSTTAASPAKGKGKGGKKGC